MQRLIVVLLAADLLACASTSTTTENASARRFIVDAPMPPLADHCRDGLGGGACGKVEELRKKQATLKSLHETHYAMWRTALAHLRQALAAGFHEPAIAIELPDDLHQSWSDPEGVAPFPVIVRLQAASGLSRSRDAAALTRALAEVVSVAEQTGKEWQAAVEKEGRGVQLPPDVERARAAVPFSLTYAYNKGTALVSTVVPVPMELLSQLEGLLTSRYAVISLVSADGDIRYRDVSSEVVALPQPFTLTISETGASLVESKPSAERHVLSKLEAPVALACRDLHAELRFFDEGTWPAWTFSIRPLADRSSP